MIIRISEVEKNIKLIEESLNVDKWTADDINIWPIFRIQLGLNMINGENNTVQEKKYRVWGIKQTVLGILSTLYKVIIDYKNNQKLEDTDSGYIFCSYSLARGLKFDKKYYDIYFSPIIEAIKRNKGNYILLERNCMLKKTTPRYEKSYYTYYDIFILSLLKKISKKDKICFSKEFEEEYSKIETILSIEKKYIPTYENFKKKISVLKMYIRYYEKILKKTKPKVAYISDYYNLDMMGFCYACRKEAIPVVEFQHGALHCVAYGKWEKIPIEGYDLLPNIFAVWENDENMRSWIENNKNYNIYVWGNVLKNIFFQKEKENIVEYSDLQLEGLFRNKNKKYKYKILYTLQTDTKVPEWLLGVIRKRSDILWILRLHPGMQSQREKYYLEWEIYKLDNVIIRNVEQLAIYSILKVINGHITSNSSVVIEAASIKRKSIILDSMGAEYYKDFIKNGWAFFAENESDLLKYLDSILSAPLDTKIDVVNPISEKIKELDVLCKKIYESG